MRGLGRLFALPWLLIALAVQSLAPAEAAAMRPDAAAMGICSAHDLSGASHRPDPARSHDHDCCAFACAIANLAAVPPPSPTPARLAFSLPAQRAGPDRTAALRSARLDQPRARGPPALLTT